MRRKRKRQEEKSNGKVKWKHLRAVPRFFWKRGVAFGNKRVFQKYDCFMED